MKKISVITITFNNFEELVKTLESLKGQTQIESVVINGGDCEKTKEFLNTYVGNITSEKDRGISDAFNKGLKKATGDYFIFLNSGDHLIDQNFYNEALALFAENPELDYIYGDLDSINIKGEKQKITHNMGFVGKMPFPHPSLIISRKVLNEVGYFSEEFKLAMDFDFAYRMLAKNYQGYYYNKSVVYMEPGGVSTQNGLLGIKERKKILKATGFYGLEPFLYLNKLVFKTYIRKCLGVIGLLSFYDKFKMKFFKLREE